MLRNRVLAFLFLFLIGCTRAIPEPENPKDPCVYVDERKYCPPKPREIRSPPPAYGNKIVLK